MIRAVPAATPVTIPVVPPIVATNVLPLVHAPPEVPSESEVVAPTHAPGVPAIDAGTGFTVTVFDVVQPIPLKP